MEFEELHNNFKEDLREFIVEQFNEIISKTNTELEIQSQRLLKKADVYVLLYHYLTYRLRIPLGKKKVFYSKEILQSPLYRAFKKRINIIHHRFDTDGNICDFLPTNKRNIQKRDGIFDDWNILHLHLVPINQRTSKNDNYLLFVYVKYDCVFFINIGIHKSFAETNLLKIIDNNWPNLLDALSNLTPTNYSAEEILDFRKYNISYVASINNKTVATGIENLNIKYCKIGIIKMIEVIAENMANNFQIFIDAINKETSKNNIIADLHLGFDIKKKKIIPYDKISKIGFIYNDDALNRLTNILYGYALL